MFNTALYYPTIDIKDDAWLKSAILFWDKIETIVPESMAQPYKRRPTRALEEAGLLSAHRVNPFSDEVRGIEQDVASYLKTREGKKSFVKPWNRMSMANSRRQVREEELDDFLKERFSRDFEDFFIHVEKLPHILHDRLNGHLNEDGFVWAREGFMSFYMTLLANRICQNEDMALLTNRVRQNDLSNKILTSGLSRQNGEDVCELKTGIMYQIIMDDIKIDPETPIEKIINYKRQRAQELNKFRQEMEKLTDFDVDAMRMEDIEHKVKQIYCRDIVPAVDDLKATLKDARIEWWANSATSYVLGGIIPTVASSGFNVANPAIVASSFGLAIGISVVNYVRNIRGLERKSPYTYLLKMNKMFSKAGMR